MFFPHELRGRGTCKVQNIREKGYVIYDNVSNKMEPWLCLRVEIFRGISKYGFNFSVLVHISDEQEIFLCHDSRILAFISVLTRLATSQIVPLVQNDY